MRTFSLWFNGIAALYDIAVGVWFLTSGKYGWAAFEFVAALIMFGLFFFWLGE